MDKKISLQRDTYLDIIEAPLLSPHTPPFVDRKPKDTKIGLALARLIDIITLKDTYTLKKERDAQHKVVKQHRIRLQQKRISLT